MQCRHLANERGLGATHILDRLTSNGFRQETHEIARMTGGERHANFAVRLHPADARSVARARIKDDEGAHMGMALPPIWRKHAEQRIVHRALALQPIHHEFKRVVQHVGCAPCVVLEIGVAALPQNVPKQNRTLPRIQAVGHRLRGDGGGKHGQRPCGLDPRHLVRPVVRPADWRGRRGRWLRRPRAKRTVRKRHSVVSPGNRGSPGFVNFRRIKNGSASRFSIQRQSNVETCTLFSSKSIDHPVDT
jgi:hypothetical protein